MMLLWPGPSQRSPKTIPDKQRTVMHACRFYIEPLSIHRLFSGFFAIALYSLREFVSLLVCQSVNLLLGYI
jgi:hypothetical protein